MRYYPKFSIKKVLINWNFVNIILLMENKIVINLLDLEIKNIFIVILPITWKKNLSLLYGKHNFLHLSKVTRFIVYLLIMTVQKLQNNYKVKHLSNGNKPSSFLSLRKNFLWKLILSLWKKVKRFISLITISQNHWVSPKQHLKFQSKLQRKDLCLQSLI